MSVADYDDTDMTNDEFNARMEDAVPVIVFTSVDQPRTGTGAVTQSADVSFAGNRTIRRALEFAGR